MGTVYQKSTKKLIESVHTPNYAGNADYLIYQATAKTLYFKNGNVKSQGDDVETLAVIDKVKAIKEEHRRVVSGVVKVMTTAQKSTVDTALQDAEDTRVANAQREADIQAKIREMAIAELDK